MKWRTVIKDYLTTMIEKNVLTPVDLEEEYSVKRPLGMIWFLNIKDDGRYRALMVDKVYLQSEGVDYDLRHSSFLCDVCCV